MQRCLVPVSTVSARNVWHNDLPFVTQNWTKNSGGGTSGKMGWGCAARLFQTKICDFPYPISDLIENLIPYFRPEALEPVWVTGARDKLLRHVHGSWSKQ